MAAFTPQQYVDLKFLPEAILDSPKLCSVIEQIDFLVRQGDSVQLYHNNRIAVVSLSDYIEPPQQQCSVNEVCEYDPEGTPFIVQQGEDYITLGTYQNWECIHCGQVSKNYPAD